MMIYIETDGMHRELVQYDTPAARATLDALRPGDTITALVSPVSTLGVCPGNRSAKLLEGKSLRISGHV
jgi:hypothetical protein